MGSERWDRREEAEEEEMKDDGLHCAMGDGCMRRGREKREGQREGGREWGEF